MPNPRLRLGQGVPGGMSNLPTLDSVLGGGDIPSLDQVLPQTPLPRGRGRRQPSVGGLPIPRPEGHVSPDPLGAAHQRLQGAVGELTRPGGGRMSPQYGLRVQHYLNLGRNLAAAQTLAAGDIQNQTLQKYNVSPQQLRALGLNPSDVLIRKPSGLEATIGEAVKMLVGMPYGLYEAVRHPIRAAETFGGQVKDVVEHPLRDPLLTALTGWGAFGGVGALTGRGLAVRSAIRGTPGLTYESAIYKLSKADKRTFAALHDPATHLDPTDTEQLNAIAKPSQRLNDVLNASARLRENRATILSQAGLKRGQFMAEGRVGDVLPRTKGQIAREVSKAAVFRPPQPLRTIVIPTEDGMGLTYHAVGSTNPLINYLQRLHDDRVASRFGITSEGFGTLPQQVSARWFSSEASAARHLSAHEDVMRAYDRAAIEPLSSYGATMPAQFFNKVAAKLGKDISLGGLKPSHGHLSGPEQYLHYAASTAKDLDTLEAAHANAAKFATQEPDIFGNPEDHLFHQALAQGARSATPNIHLERSLAMIRKTMAMKDQVYGVTDEEKWLRLGQRDAYIDALASGHPTPPITDLDRDSLIARGKAVEANGGFDLPQVQDLSRQPSKARIGFSPYGARAPEVPAFEHYDPQMLLRGRERKDITNLAYAQGRQALDFKRAKEGFDKILKLSTKEKMGPNDIAIRENSKTPQELKDFVHGSLPGGLSQKEFDQLSDRMLAVIREHYFPSTPGKNVRWIDPRYFRVWHNQHLPLRGGAGKVLDAANAPFRASLLYAKPAYAVNLLQNLGTAATNQGFWLVPNMIHALGFGEHVSADNMAIIQSLMGESLSRSFRAQGGPGRGAIDAAGEFWNHVVDKFPRITSWLHEARRQGFNTPALVDALLHDPELQDTMVHITRRANREIIDYGGMTPFEKNNLRRLLFFYPWMRAATLWSARFPLEHPLLSAAGGYLGKQGEQYIQQYGHLPSWMEGYIPISPFDRTSPWMINPASVNNFASAAQVAQTLMAMFTANSPAAAGLANQLGPVSTLFYTLVSGQDSLGRPLRAGENRISASFKQLMGLIPEVQFVQRLEKKGGIKPGGFWPALTAFSGGSTAGSRIALARAQQQGEKEHKGTLNKHDAIIYRTQQKVASIPQLAQQLQTQGITLSPDDAQQLAADYHMMALKDIFFEKAAEKAGVTVRHMSAIDRLNLTIAFLHHFNKLSADDAATIKSIAPDLHSDQQLRDLEHRLWAGAGIGATARIWEGIGRKVATPTVTPAQNVQEPGAVIGG